ncbi:MAG: MATE family efflux transporter [Clostridiales bacterium]|nr:MATE family efflux transporter [Clostridiales bacterium]
MKDLTEGSSFKNIVLFSLPMLCSIIFQQMYNIADSVIVGKYAGVEELAAVGASYPVTVLFLAVAVGAGVGTSVVAGMLFGSREYRDLKSTIYTAFTSMMLLSLLLVLIGSLACGWILDVLKTPENIWLDSRDYLRIYIWGMPFLFLYNISNSIFQALGDSKTPLKLLIFSSVLNVVLDYVFVAEYHWDVQGVAWATFLAQGLASVLAFVILLRKLKELPVGGRTPLFEAAKFRRILIFAVPSIMQQSFVSVGQLMIQGVINGFGYDVIAGFSAAYRINTFVISSVVTMGNALSGFASQNYGAGYMKRVKEGMRASMLLTVSFSLVAIAAVYLGGHKMMGLFLEAPYNQGVMDSGIRFLWIVAPSYIMLTVKTIIDNMLKGVGQIRAFTITTFVDLIIRVGFVYAFAGILGYGAVCWAYPCGYTLGAIVSWCLMKLWDKSISPQSV